MIVTIDGPAGSGKSTTAKLVARELSFGYLDSGALYRTVALKWLRLGSKSAVLGRSGPDVASDENPGDLQTDDRIGAELLSSAAHRDALLPDAVLRDELSALVKGVSLEVRADAAGSLIFELDGEDVSGFIRDEKVGAAASIVSGYKVVRDHVTELQRKFAEVLEGQDVGVVVEGRDIGTVVFPSADVKYFLEARPEVRATRRLEELRSKGEVVQFADVLEKIVTRDFRDRNRPLAPLVPAHDAIVVDTSELEPAAVVGLIAKTVAERLL